MQIVFPQFYSKMFTLFTLLWIRAKHAEMVILFLCFRGNGFPQITGILCDQRIIFYQIHKNNSHLFGQKIHHFYLFCLKYWEFETRISLYILFIFLLFAKKLEIFISVFMIWKSAFVQILLKWSTNVEKPKFKQLAHCAVWKQKQSKSWTNFLYIP